MKSRLAFAITGGLPFAALGTFIGALFSDTFIPGCHATEDCEHSWCEDMEPAYTEEARKCRVLSTGERVTGNC